MKLYAILFVAGVIVGAAVRNGYDAWIIPVSMLGLMIVLMLKGYEVLR